MRILIFDQEQEFHQQIQLKIEKLFINVDLFSCLQLNNLSQQCEALMPDLVILGPNAEAKFSGKIIQDSAPYAAILHIWLDRTYEYVHDQLKSELAEGELLKRVIKSALRHKRELLTDHLITNILDSERGYEFKEIVCCNLIAQIRLVYPHLKNYKYAYVDCSQVTGDPVLCCNPGFSDNLMRQIKQIAIKGHSQFSDEEYQIDIEDDLPVHFHPHFYREEYKGGWVVSYDTKRYDWHDRVWFDQLNRLCFNLIYFKREHDTMKRLYQAIECLDDSVIITDEHGSIQYVNPASCEKSGYSEKECLGHSPRIFKSGVHDEKTFEVLWKNISNGVPWQGILTNKCKNGSYIVEDVKISPVISDLGEIHHYIGIKKDITEKLKLEKVLERNQKMETIAVLASGVAHDFNNILMVVKGYVQLLEKKFSKMNQSFEEVAIIKDALNKAQGLVRQLMLYSKQLKPNKKICQVKEVFEKAVKLCETMIPKEVVFEHNIKVGVKMCLDETQMAQMMFNLVQNAVHAVEDVPQAKISLEIESMVPAVVLKTMKLEKSMKCLSIRIKDNGIGMDQTILKKIFDPFFSTKDHVKGSGLGLASVWGIVKNHEGEVVVDSKPGLGSTFNIYLPIFEQESPNQ